MTMRGSVDSVRIVYLGAYLAADAAISATTITVDAVTDFSETGGSLRLNAVTYTYLAADFTTNVITLASGLTGAATSGQRVDVYPLTPEKQAMVMVSGGEDVMTARVPHSLFDRMPEGIRAAATAESVEFVDFGEAGGELVISDVVGKAPVIDASFVDTTLGQAKDGLPPASAPTGLEVVGGPGFLFAKWTGVTNADQVQYEVNVSKTNNFTPTSGTLLTTTADTSFTINRTPGTIPTPPAADTTKLVYGTTYYIKIRAIDVDGAGPYSAQVSGKMVQVTGPDIAPASVTTPKIVAGSITGDLFAAQILLASMIKTASSGQRWEGDNLGIRLFGQTGQVTVNLPTGTGETALFTGAGQFDTLSVGQISITGTSGTVDTNAGIAMSSGIVKPSNAPTSTVEYDFLQLDITTARTATSGPSLYGSIPPNSSNWQHCWIEGTTVLWVVENFVGGSGSRLWKYDMTTGAHSEVYDWANYVSSLTKLGASYYVMWTQTWDIWYITPCTTVPSEAGAWLGRYTTNISPGSIRDMCIGNNGTDLLLSDVNDSTAELWVRIFTMPGAQGNVTITVNHVAGGVSWGTTLNPLYSNVMLHGNFDYGAARYVVAPARTTYQARSLTVAASAVYQTNEEFPNPSSDRRGMAWDGTRFWTMGIAGKLHKHTTITWTTESANWWLGHTWNRTAATAAETDLGAKALVVAKKRARVRVSIPALAGLAGATDPDSWRLYWNRNATSPASTTMKLQATVSGGTLTYFVDTLDVAGVAPPVTNNFPASTPGYARASTLGAGGNPKIDLRGDGYAYLETPRIPLLTADASRTTKPRGRLVTTITRSVANSSLHTAVFDTATGDGVTAAAAGTFTIVYAGYYLINWNPRWAGFGMSNAGGATYIYKNGVKMAEVTAAGITCVEQLAVSDVLTFRLWQQTGAALDILADSIAVIQWEGP